MQEGGMERGEALDGSQSLQQAIIQRHRLADWDIHQRFLVT